MHGWFIASNTKQCIQLIIPVLEWRQNESDSVIGVSIICSKACSGTVERNHQSSVSLAFVRGIQRWPVEFLHKGPVTRKMFPFDDVIIFWNNHDLLALRMQCWITADGELRIISMQGSNPGWYRNTSDMMELRIQCYPNNIKRNKIVNLFSALGHHGR